MYEDETTRWLRQYVRELFQSRNHPLYPHTMTREFLSCAIEELRRRRHARSARRIFS